MATFLIILALGSALLATFLTPSRVNLVALALTFYFASILCGTFIR